MGIIKLQDYLVEIKKERKKFFKNAFERAYASFLELGFDKKDSQFFEENASKVIEDVREQCWKDYLAEEKNFTIFMLKKLIDRDIFAKMDSISAIEKYVSVYPEHIYQLNLSNTQSRRSSAGNEFEDIIELILLGAGVSMDSQGNIGKENFVQKGLGKLVDAVSPGVVEFEENKRNVVLISAKTTLRERWQEVPEEMGRTGAREMFLATLDEKISNDVLRALYEANIQVTTTKEIKEKSYVNYSWVLTFEDLMKICHENSKKWEGYMYSIERSTQAVEMIQKQIVKHEEHDFVKSSLLKRLAAYQERLTAIKNS